MAFDLFILILIGIALLVGKAGREQLAEANAAPYATRRTINGLTILAFVMFMLGVLMMFARGIMILGGGCGGNEKPARQAKRPVPVQAPPIVPVTDPRLKVRQVTTSRGRSGFEQSTCAVMNTGGVKCWGRNDHGLIGADSIGYYVPVPVDVQNTSDVAAVYLGDSHACALTKNGRVKCWGAHSVGRLGNGSDKDSTVPTVVPGLSGVKAISVGLSHTCAVTNANRVKCWGDNEAHQVGIGPIGIGPTRDPEYDSDTWWRLPVPVPVPGLSGIAAVAAGDRHTCALAKTGKVKCWGSFRLSDREAPSEDVVEIPGLSDVTAIAAGSDYTCALTKAGAVECWGKNDEGELGDGSTTESDIPGDVFGLSEIIAISAGSTASCALTRAGRVKCWGEISTLTGTGDGTNERHLTPIEIPSLSDAVSVSVGGTHACALTSGGAVVCWGDNMSGQLGNGTSTFVSLVPIQVKF